MKTIKELLHGIDEAKVKKMKGEDPCWADYEMVGTKKKNGKEVPNCVPKNEEVEQVDELNDAERLKKGKSSSDEVRRKYYNKAIDAMNGNSNKEKDKSILRYFKVKQITDPDPDPKLSEEVEQVDEMDKSAPQPGRDGKVSHSTYGSRDRDDKDDYFKGKESPGKAVTAKQAQKDALDILKKQGVAEGYKEPTDAAGHAKMAAKIKKMLDDTLADRGDRHGNPDPQQLARAYEYHMQKSKEKSQGVAEGQDWSPGAKETINKDKIQSLKNLISKYKEKKNDVKVKELERELKSLQTMKEENEQIDELNKDTLYSYNKKADADIEKKHKTLGQLMRKGDAPGANKAAHQLNRRVAGMERAEKRLNKEEVEVEESKKIPASDKPVNPKDLVVSLKDVPVKKPRGHTQYDPSKEFPGVKALKREEVETAAQVTKHFEKGQSTPTGVPKWVASVLKAKKKLQKEQADKELMGAQPTGGKKLAAKFEKAFKAMGQPRKVNCMTVGQISSCEETELEFNNLFTEAMKKKPEADSKQNLKKGEKLSGKQEPITISPEIEKKGVA